MGGNMSVSQLDHYSSLLEWDFPNPQHKFYYNWEDFGIPIPRLPDGMLWGCIPRFPSLCRVVLSSLYL